MSTNYFDTPSFAPRKKTTPFAAPAAPSFAPADPTVPLRAGAQVADKDLRRRGSTLSSKYQPQRTMAIQGARAGLAGFGGYSVSDDGQITHDPNARPGSREAEAYQNEVDAAGAAGMDGGSIAKKNISRAMARLSVEAQQVVNQHAATMNNLVTQEASEYDEINSGLLQLYGGEAQWAIDNPPPPPPDPPVTEEGPAAPKRRVLALPNSKNWTPAQVDKWNYRHPGWTMKKRGDGSWVALKEGV